MQLFAPNVEKLAEKRDLKGLAKAVGYEKSRKVQVAAVNALAELGDVDGVIAALDADEPSVRTAAIEALGDIGESRAIPPLVRVALTDPSHSSYEPQFQYTR